MVRPLGPLLVLLLLLAGCSEPGIPEGEELVVQSKPLIEAKSADGSAGQTLAPAPPDSILGHLAGVVVDSSITPLEDAVVTIPGLDISDTTVRGGTFSFTDLIAGQYFVRAEAPGHATAETVVEVKAEEFTRVKFVLERIPPPTPKVTTQEFRGYIDVTNGPIVILGTCGGCEFEFLAGEPGLQWIVIDAFMDGYSGAGGEIAGSNSFYWDLYREGDYVDGGQGGNPLNALVDPGVVGNLSRTYELRVEPESFPAPEPSKPFTVYVTTWVNATPPSGWRFGDPVPGA